jgi:nucleoside-diphosphate-sugar epimerase
MTVSINPPSLIGVTGATGFVGQHLIRQALAAGYRVRAMVRTPVKLGDLHHENLDVFAHGLGVDDAAFVKGCDAIIHLAGLIKAPTRAAFDAVNVAAASRLARVAETAGISRFILFSSMTARVPELSDYAASKHAGEVAVKATFTGPLAVIRAPAIFGPGDEATAPIMRLIEKGILPTAGGAGWKKRRLSLVAVEDIVADCLSRGLSGDYDEHIVSPCNVGNVTWPEFAEMASAAAGRSVKALPIPLPVIFPVAASTSLTSRLLNKGHLTLGKLREFRYDDWSSTDLIEGVPSMESRLRETLLYYKTHKD